MRIAILQPDKSYTYGGAQRVMEGVIPKLSSTHSVAFFGFSFVLESAVERHLTDWRNASLFLKRFELFSERRSLIELMKDVNKWSPDILLLNSHSDLAAWISKKAHAPTVFYAHDITNLKWLTPSQGVRDRYRRIIGLRKGHLGQTKLVICVSRFLETAYKSTFPKLSTKVIYNGVDHQHFRPSWQDEGFGLCVSRITGKKNLALLRDAYADSPYQVVLLGDANYKGADPVEDFVQGSSLAFEQFLSQDQLLGELQRCSFFVNPGKNEGMPLAPLEAMACGKPVIAHNSGGTPETVGDAGFLLGDDPRQWRLKADELMSSSSKRREMGKKAYERSLNFTWDKTAKQLEEALIELKSASKAL